jgi:hypothetical protein
MKIGRLVAMNKRPSVRRIVRPKENTGGRQPNWHNGADVEIRLYARSLQNAAKTLVEGLELDQNSTTIWDASPVVVLYRQALEIHLKLLVGEGSNFLKPRTDPISLYRTHSLRWLAQIVCQIIKTVGWEGDFKCEGLVSLADFSALVNEVESSDPITRAVHPSSLGVGSSVSQNPHAFNVVGIAKRMDALLDLLDVTADALAATWDRRAALETDFQTGNDFEATVQ